MTKIKIMALIIGLIVPSLAIGYVSASYSSGPTGVAKLLNNSYFTENSIEVFRFTPSASSTEACYILKQITGAKPDFDISCVK